MHWLHPSKAHAAGCDGWPALLPQAGAVRRIAFSARCTRRMSTAPSRPQCSQAIPKQSSKIQEHGLAGSTEAAAAAATTEHLGSPAGAAAAGAAAAGASTGVATAGAAMFSGCTFNPCSRAACTSSRVSRALPRRHTAAAACRAAAPAGRHLPRRPTARCRCPGHLQAMLAGPARPAGPAVPSAGSLSAAAGMPAPQRRTTGGAWGEGASFFGGTSPFSVF